MEKTSWDIMDGDGNAFAIMGRVTQALRKAKAPKEDIDQYLAESRSGDYDNLLQVSLKWLEQFGYE